MKTKNKVNRSQGSHDPREMKLEIGSRGESYDFKSETGETQEILGLLEGNSIGIDRLSDIERAVKILVGRTMVPESKVDPFEFVSFEEIVSQFRGTPRSVERQIEAKLGKSVTVKLGKTKGIRKVNLLRYFELIESNN